MPLMNQPSRTSLHRPLLLLVLTGALGACGEESPPPGLLVFDRDAHDFGQAHVGEAGAEQVFTIRNAGPDQLDELGVRLEPADSFEILGSTCAGWLAPSETCTVTVAFSPVQAGPAQADLVIEADGADASTALTGLGAVTVRVTKPLFEEVTVESEPAGILCGAVCEATFTVPEIVLRVVEDGQPRWTGDCKLALNGDCQLTLRGDIEVNLFDFLVGLDWVLYGGGQTNAVVTDPANNVIRAATSAPRLSKHSPDGELIWQVDNYGVGTAAVDAEGNIGFASVAGVVSKIRPDGGAIWSEDFTPDALDVRHIAFDPDGNLYVAGTKSSSDTVEVHLRKLDRNGALVWFRTYAPLPETSVADMVVDPSGYVIIAGLATSKLPEPTSFHYMRKYERDGDVLWTHEGVEIMASSLAVDSAGNIFLANRVVFSFTLIKYDPDGQRLWAVYDDELGGRLSDLAVTPEDDVVAIGSRSDAEGDPAGAWAVKLDGQDGALRRPIKESNVPGQAGTAIAVDGSGDVIMAAGEVDAWMRKYDRAQLDQPNE